MTDLNMVEYSRKRKKKNKRTDIDFAAVNRAALPALPAVLARWLPDGKRVGHEWLARNPRRCDHEPGSFKVNMHTGKWADFATGDCGGDVISLAAYLHNLSQADAARRIAAMLGIEQEARNGR